MYTDTDPDVLDHDDDLDAELYTYEKRQAYRGRYDPRYTKEDLDVHWLYDENSKRVGLVEYESADFSVSSVLWFYDNPYSTMFQEPGWKSEDKTLWSMLSNEAYQDCLEDDFKTIFDRCLSSKYRLVTPEFLINPPQIYECTKCGKKSLNKLKNCSDVIETSYFSNSNLLFVDDSFIIYEKSIVQQPSSSFEQEQVLEQVPEQPPQVQSPEQQSLQTPPQPE
jgi:hypothetical protein